MFEGFYSSIRKNLVIYLSLVLNILAVILVFAKLTDNDLYTYTWSDTLYLPAIFQDVFIDKSGFSGWNLNGAPNFFPDMFIYFIIRTFTANFLQASFLFSIIQVFLILVFGYFLYKTLLPKASPLLLSISIFSMIIFLYVHLIRGDFVYTYYLISITFHTGSYLMMLITAFISIKYLKNRNTWLLALLILLQIIGCFNDKLYILQFSIPFFLANAFFILFKKYRKVSITLSAVTILSIYLSSQLYRALSYATSLTTISVDNKIMQWGGIRSAYEVLLNQHLNYFREIDIRGLINVLVVLSFLISTVVLVYRLKSLVKKKQIDNQNYLEIFYLIFILSNFVLVFNGPAINGYYPSAALMRMNIFALYLQVINYTFLIYLFVTKAGKKYFINLIPGSLLFINVAIIAILFIKINIGTGLTRYLNYYPPSVRAIDELAQKEGLTYGVGSYTIAKYSTMLSRNNVRIYHTHDNLRPWHHMTNENWYYGVEQGIHKNARFNFIILNGLNEEKVYEKTKNHIVDTLVLPEINLVVLKTDSFLFEKYTKNLLFEKSGEVIDVVVNK